MSNKLDPLHADIAQVQHDDAGFATGRLIGDNLVLTCAHVLWRSQEERDLGTISPRLEDWKVRLERDNGDSGWCFRRGNRVVWHCPALDLALIQLVEPPEGTVRPKLRLCVADITGNNPHHAEARGYPGASKETDETPKRKRLTPALGRLTAGKVEEPIIFGIDTCDLPNDPKDPHYGWPGMSGSAVMFQEPPDPEAIWIYGVVKHVPGHFNGQLRVARLAAAWRVAAFKALLVSGGVPDQPPEDPTCIDPGPQPELETTPYDGGSGVARYGYRARAATLAGRDQELGLFEAFLGRPETFLWCGIEGAGGVGKSRFVLEALLAATGWHAGFLRATHFDWTRWTPNRPTVIAIDDARARQPEVLELIEHLAARRASDALWRKVRVVLIDRDLALDELFRGREVTRPAFEKTRHQPGMPLGPLDSDAIRSIIRQMAPEANDDALKRADEWRATHGAEGNPLLAMLAAEIAAATDGSAVSTLKDVVVDRLAAWGILPRPGPAAVPALEADDRLALAFATVCAYPSIGLKFGELPKLVAPPGVPLAEREAMCLRLSHALGQPIKDAIPMLAPDLFGELFVLEVLRRLRELAVDDGGAFMAAAWAQRNSRAAIFCRRCWADFPEHPEALRLLGRPPSGSRTDVMSWMYAANTRYAQCRAQGRSKEAQEIIARVIDAYVRDRYSCEFGIVVDLHTVMIDFDRAYDRTEAVRSLVALLDLSFPTDLADIPAEHPKLRTEDEVWADLLDDGPKAYDKGWISALEIKAKWLVDACFEAADEPALEQLEDAFRRAFLDISRKPDKVAYERPPVLRDACVAFLELAKMIPSKRESLALDASVEIVRLFFRRDPETAMTVEEERKLMGWLNALATHLWILFADPSETDEDTVLKHLPVAKLARQRFSGASAGEVDLRIADIIVGLADHDRMAQAKALFAAWRDAPTRIGGDGNDRARRERLIQRTLAADEC